MNRKSLILCLSALAVMVLGIGIAVAVLYSGTGAVDKETEARAADADRCPVLCAVPSDAVLVALYDNANEFPALKESQMAMSLHYYSGKLQKLYVLTVGEDPIATESVISDCRSRGMCVALEGNLILISDSETLFKSAQRHLEKGICILEAAGFHDALKSESGSNLLYISNSHIGELLPQMLQRTYSSYAGFLERLADWSVFELETSKESFSMSGTHVYDTDASDFMNVFEAMKPATSDLSQIIPSYTLFAASMPMKDISAFVDAYKSYLDSRQKMQLYLAAQTKLGLSVTPVELLKSWKVSEVAIASFKIGSKVETVNLMKVGKPEVTTLFKGTGVTSLRGYVPSLHSWAYPSLISSVFGDFFTRKDESCFTYIDGWVVTGSKAAVEEYVSGRALEYNLKTYMSNAGKSDLLAKQSATFVAYFSFTEDSAGLSSIFKTEMLNDLQDLSEGAEYCPFVLTVSGGKNDASASLDIYKLTMKKTQAPVFERDTVVVVPKGPFEVKNSGTGKMNRFWQNKHNSLCLSEDGRDLWGIPFDRQICGRAGTVDYYANGKLQILFCAADKLYLIDRLGRYVAGFPLSLGKEIVLGPDIYDFNGTKQYNVIVLHKDNTLEMYNLKGKKPASWKGITATETIKNLPERLVVGNNTYWVVRTSIQTLIYPFYGGAPLTDFTGNQMIRPDSEVTVVDATTVQFTCYDGKKRTAKL